ncbi:MAG: malonate decarboxylase holo-[acyl-carrier-protein] synthase [Gallionella sp.]
MNRHDLLWIRSERIQSVIAQCSDIEIRQHLATWLIAGRPLVVACQSHGTSSRRADEIAVGLALPPLQGKHRIPLTVTMAGIARNAMPLLLSDVVTDAPEGWQAALRELDAGAKRIGVELRVYGSLAWQALSGLTYLTSQSDIDLLWHPRSSGQLQQGIALLADWEHSSGLRADGEVFFSNGDAVSWRELATTRWNSGQRVLVKRLRGAELVDGSALLKALA